MKNIWLKLSSIAVAVLLWYFVNSESNLTLVSFIAPIEIREVPQGKVVLQQSHKEAHVSIKGPSFLIGKIASAPPNFRIKIPSSAEGRYVVPLQKAALELPPYVTVISVDPAELELTFDSLGKKVVPVVVPRIGNLNGSLTVKTLDIIPHQVTVSGPESELEGISSVETYPLDLRGVTGSFERGLNLRQPNSRVDLSDGQVSIKAAIEPVTAERRLTGLALELRTPPGEKYMANVSRVSVLLYGPEKAVAELQPSQIIPYVRVDAGQESPAELPVVVEAPDGIAVMAVDPPRVVISRADAAKREVKDQRKK